MSVESTWAELMSWCQISAPRTAQAIEPGAAPADLDHAAAAFAQLWPAELQELYRLQNGTSEDSFALDGLLFGFTPLPLSQLLEEATVRSEASAELFDADEVAACAEDEAGSTCPFWVAPLVPFARGVGGNVLCVDLRPGTEHGCVVDFDDDGFGQASWPSLTSLLAQVLDSLQSGRAHDDLRPEVVDGELAWV